MTDPVVASDGFTYERSNITRYLRHIGYSPVTCAPIIDCDLTPARSLRAQMRDANLRLVEDADDLSSSALGAQVGAASLAEQVLHLTLEARHLAGSGASLPAEKLARLEAQIVQLRHACASSFAARIGAWAASCSEKAGLPSRVVYNALQCLFATKAEGPAEQMQLLTQLVRLRKFGASAAKSMVQSRVDKGLALIEADKREEIAVYLTP